MGIRVVEQVVVEVEVVGWAMVIAAVGIVDAVVVVVLLACIESRGRWWL